MNTRAKGTSVSGPGGRPAPKSTDKAPFPSDTKPPIPGAPTVPAGAPSPNVIKGSNFVNKKVGGGR